MGVFGSFVECVMAWVLSRYCVCHHSSPHGCTGSWVLDLLWLRERLPQTGAVVCPACSLPIEGAELVSRSADSIAVCGSDCSLTEKGNAGSP